MKKTFRNLMTLVMLVLFAMPTPVSAQTTDASPADPLSGLRIGVLGDSYVKNHRRPMEETWHYKFAQKHGMQYFNYGRNGNAISVDREKWGPAMYKRYTQMADSLDYVVVIAGHNDCGFIDSIGLGTFKERLGILCDGLVERYPTARIYFFTPWNNSAEPGMVRVVDAMLEVCGSRGIPVFDAFRQSNILAQSDTFRRIFFQGPNDHAHLNAKGHDRFLPVAEAFILSH